MQFAVVAEVTIHAVFTAFACGAVATVLRVLPGITIGTVATFQELITGGCFTADDLSVAMRHTRMQFFNVTSDDCRVACAQLSNFGAIVGFGKRDVIDVKFLISKVGTAKTVGAACAIRTEFAVGTVVAVLAADALK